MFLAILKLIDEDDNQEEIFVVKIQTETTCKQLLEDTNYEWAICLNIGNVTKNVYIPHDLETLQKQYPKQIINYCETEIQTQFEESMFYIISVSQLSFHDGIAINNFSIIEEK